MGGNHPVTFITIGGVRYHKASVVEQSETADDKGNKTYNVTLEGGTKLSYPLQEKSNYGYTVNIFKRNEFRPGTTNMKVTLNGDRRPLILAHKPMNNGNDVQISIFGLKNATVQGNPNIGEYINFTNCQNNTIYMNDGNHTSDGIMHADYINVDSCDDNKNNTVYIDYFDYNYEFPDEDTDRNTIIRDEAPPQEVIDNTETL